MEKVLIFVSSLNMNAQLANTFQEQLNTLGIESEMINLVNLELPMYDSKKEELDGIPKEVYPYIQKMKEHRFFLFVTPEYNFCVPPVLVNFIAWISREGEDFRELFTLKTIQLASHSGGNGKDCLQALRMQFTRLGSIVMPREIIATYEKPLNKKSSLKILGSFSNIIKAST